MFVQLPPVFFRIDRQFHRPVRPGGQIGRIGELQCVDRIFEIHQQRFAVQHRPGKILKDLLLAGFIRFEVFLPDGGLKFLTGIDVRIFPVVLQVLVKRRDRK